MNAKKLSGIVGIAIMGAAFLLFVFGVISAIVFWIVAGLMAFFAWWALPRIR